VASIDAAFNDNERLLRRAKEQARAGREKGWNTSAKPPQQPQPPTSALAAAEAASSTSAVAAAAVPSRTANSRSGGSVAHPHKFSTSNGPSSHGTPHKAGSAPAPALSQSPNVPSALEERHAARAEREELQLRYAHRLDQMWQRRARRTLLRVWRRWAALACTPRESSLRARAFAQFHLLLRTLHTWAANGKALRERKLQADVQQQQAKENRLQQRALKFHRMKMLLKCVHTA
jgi:hypothetical protein